MAIGSTELLMLSIIGLAICCLGALAIAGVAAVVVLLRRQ